MSCKQTPNRVARTGCLSGIPPLAGKAAYAAASLGRVRRWPGQLAGWLRQVWGKVFDVESQASRRPIFDPASVPELGGREIVQPTATDQLAGKPCAGCQAWPERKPGPWYVIAGQAYCQDCAPGPAAEANADLALVPAPSMVAAPSAASSPARIKVPVKRGRGEYGRGATAVIPAPAVAPVPTRLARRPVTVRVEVIDPDTGAEQPAEYAIDNAYEVLTPDGQPTGLALTPTVDIAREVLTNRPLRDAAGQVQLETDERTWNITHLASGTVARGGFADLEAARKLAARLATLDWNRSLADIPPEDLSRARRIVDAYQRERDALARADLAEGDDLGDRPLEGELVFDTYYDQVVRVVDDQAGAVVVVAGDGEFYRIPRAEARRPDEGDYEAARLAWPFDPVEEVDICTTCGAWTYEQPGKTWFKVEGLPYCEGCTHEVLPKTGYVLPDNYGGAR